MRRHRRAVLGATLIVALQAFGVPAAVKGQQDPRGGGRENCAVGHSRRGARCRSFGLIAVVSALMVSMFLAVPASASDGDEDRSRERGQDRGEGHSDDDFSSLQARWWQWALETTADTNPILDETGEDCARNQRGRTWFLAGTFGGSATRRCTIPANKTLFFPVANNVYLGFPNDPNDTEELARAQAACIRGAAVSATLDGKPVRIGRFSESTVFGVTVVADGLLTSFGFPPGTVLEPSADAGYYATIRDLKPGEHTLRFTAAAGTSTCPQVRDVTYNLTVLGRVRD